MRGILSRDAELARRQVDTLCLGPAHERRPHATRLKGALDPAVVEAGLLEREDVLDEDLVVVDPVDLGDVDDLARAAVCTCGMDDEVDRGRDLFWDGAAR